MEGEWQPNGGTSAATPLFAGILTLLNQYLAASGKPSGLGNINPTLYHLAQTTTGIFHDVTVGSNIVPCKAGSTKCTTGSYGFSTGPGYDQATGLGSVDVNNLVTQWAGGGSTPICDCDYHYCQGKSAGYRCRRKHRADRDSQSRQRNRFSRRTGII
jgi:subtilase family serine protease